MEARTVFFSGAAINGTISMDIGTLSPAVVSTSLVLIEEMST